MFSDKEYSRYNRHLILDQVGEAGQAKLKKAKVAVVGAGGLGCPVLQYLVAAGVGKIGIIDFDIVDESNLQRQVLFGVSSVGKSKAEAAKERLEDLNPFIEIIAHNERLTTENALEIFNEYDIVVDGSDNFSTRYLVNDACVILDKVLVYGSIYKFEGQVSVFNYKGGPTYRCLFSNPPKAGSVPNCSQIGVIGVLPGLIGTQQANEVIKIILEIGEPLAGKLLMYNALNASTQTIEFSKNGEAIEEGPDSIGDFKEMDYEYFCGVGQEEAVNELTYSELLEMIENEEVQLIDVRESFEQPKLEIEGINNFTFNKIAQHVPQINRESKVVIFCQIGERSKSVIKFLKEEYGYNNLINLKGGVEAIK